MIIGGIANLIWGAPRTTADIDVTVDVAVSELERFVSLVSEIGTPVLDDPVRFFERNRVLPVRTEDGVVVDFVLATLSFELEAIARATVTTIGGIEARVCSARDLIVHKIVSERPRDHEDVVGILKRSGRLIDLDALDGLMNSLASDLENPEIADRYRTAKDAAGIGEIPGN